MKKLFLFLLFTGIILGQSKQDILNNLQRGGTLDIQDASPTSSYDVLMWDGDELKLVTITILGTVFPSLDVTGDIVLENDEYIDNSTDGDVKFIFDDDATALGQYFIISSVDTPNVADSNYMELLFEFNDDSSGLTDYAVLKVIATDVSDESEDSEIEFKTFAAGTQVSPLKLTGSNATISGRLNVDSVATTSGASIGGTLNVAPASSIELDIDIGGINFADFKLHTVVAGDSALGRMFVDAADTTLKMGSGTDLIVIKDLIP